MNIGSTALALAFAAGMCSVSVCGADADFSFRNVYLKVGGGPNWGDDIETTRGVSYELDQGFRIDFAPGAQFGDYFAIELEIGFLQNDLDRRVAPSGAVTDLDGEFWRVPLLLNFVGQYPMGKFKPYLGLGFGAVYQDVDASGGGVTVADSDTHQALQVFLGAEWEFAEGWSAGINYKYLRTVVKDDYWLWIGPLPEEMKDRGDHSIMGALRYRF